MKCDWLWALALCSSCGGSMEGAPPNQATPLSVQVGTGQMGSFRQVEPGQGLLLQRGCQGSQHIFTGVRVWGAEGPLQIHVSILRSEDRVLASVPLEVRLPAERDPQEATALRITGLTPVIEVPRDVLDRKVEVLVKLTDAKGRSGAGLMAGVVSWGPDSCGS